MPTWDPNAEQAYEEGFKDGQSSVAKRYLEPGRLPGLSEQQTQVLRIIKEIGPSSTKQITAALGRAPKSRGSVNRTLQSLAWEDNQLIEEDCLFDLPITGRSYDVWKLTKRGRRLLR